MTKIPSILEMLQAGVHFGHESGRWHPKMEPYIYGVRNGVHIIDLEKTEECLARAQEFIKKVVAKNGTILFLGTKKQVQPVITAEAQRCGVPYLTLRWIGGFFTNFPVVVRIIQKYKDLVRKRDAGELNKYTKKEQLDFEKEIQRLQELVYGVKDLEKVPDAIFVWDVRSQKTAIAEAITKKIPIIGICDTNCKTEGIDYVIPCNDDATKAIKLIIAYIADCILEAKQTPIKN
ncbi:MAG: 30S ribosomal protein S2 [Candidatus Parcubacteria bacterium]|nr:30S ribosomal protein S2 [Candidatus Parcubacteria bacterium]